MAVPVSSSIADTDPVIRCDVRMDAGPAPRNCEFWLYYDESDIGADSCPQITCIMVWMPMPTMPREPQTYVASSDEGEQAGVELPYRSRSATQPVADSAFCPVLLERRSVNLQRDHSYSASSGADAKTADFSSRSGEFSMREKTPLPHGYEDEDTEVERVEEDARTERTSGDRRSFVTAETTQNAAPARTQELPGDRGIPLSHVDVIRAARMQRR